MSISYQDLQTYAQELLDQANDEIAYRNAAGRSYYAAYHACLSVTDGLPNYADVRGGAHQVLIERLKGSKNTNLRSMGHSLKSTRSFRKIADYHLDEPFPRQHAVDVINQTDKMFARVQDYLRGAPAHLLNPLGQPLPTRSFQTHRNASVDPSP